MFDRRFVVFACIMLLLVPANGIGSVDAAATTTPTITFSGADSVAVNSSTTVDLVASDVATDGNIGSYKIEIQYDPTLISLRAEGTSHFAIQQSRSNGVLTIVGYTDESTTPGGNLSLAQLTISGEETADSASLDITVKSLSDTEGNSVAYSVRDTAIEVTKQSDTTTTTTTATSGGGGGGGGSSAVPPPPVQLETSRLGPNSLAATVTNARYKSPGEVSLPDDGFSENGARFEAVSIVPSSREAEPAFNLKMVASADLPESVPVVPSADMKFAYLQVTKNYINNNQIDSTKIQFSVDAATLNEAGSSPQNVVLYRYHESSWQQLNTKFKKNRGGRYYFSATAPGFSVFAIGASQTSFELSGGSLSKSNVATGESVTASATVRNTGEGKGSYTAKLRVDGSVVATKQVSLASGEQKTVKFTHTFKKSGSHSVAINGRKLGTVSVSGGSETSQTATTSSGSGESGSGQSSGGQSGNSSGGSSGPDIPAVAIFGVAVIGAAAFYFFKVR